MWGDRRLKHTQMRFRSYTIESEVVGFCLLEPELRLRVVIDYVVAAAFILQFRADVQFAALGERRLKRVNHLQKVRNALGEQIVDVLFPNIAIRDHSEIGIHVIACPFRVEMENPATRKVLRQPTSRFVSGLVRARQHSSSNVHRRSCPGLDRDIHSLDSER